MFSIKIDKKDLGVMAVVTDEKNRLSEVIDVDHIAVGHFTANYLAEIFQVSLVWGGFSSTGKWHTDPRMEVANLSVSGKREEQKELYKKCMCDENGNFSCAFSDAFFKKLLLDWGMLELANERLWGFDEFSAIIDNEVVYRKTKKGV